MQVVVQGIPEILVLEWNQEQSAVTVNSQFPITTVEASQVVDSCSLSEEFAAPAEVTPNTSSTSTSSSALVRDVAHATPAPEIDVIMHDNVGQNPAACNIFVFINSTGTARRLEAEQKLEFLAILILD